MATYSSNTTIKIGSTISQWTGGLTPSGFSYTVPSGSYLSLSNISVSGQSVTIDFPAPHATNETYSTTTAFTPARHLPAGTVISASAAVLASAEFSGMLFTNTP